MARYLVIGCAGFLGSWISQALVERGETVRGFDNFEPGRKQNLAEILDRIEFVEGDLRDAFGYKPLVGFEEGLRRTVKWYKQQMKEAAPQSSLA